MGTDNFNACKNVGTCTKQLRVGMIVYKTRASTTIYPGADTEGVQGVWTNPPGSLRLHILCAYLVS